MEGYLLIDKPISWTSFDVVKFVRGMLARAGSVSPKTIRVGHSGTLDPFASGLMIVLIGKSYTKRATELIKKDKSYLVTMELGTISSTGDIEGVLTKTKSPTKQPSKQLIEQTLDNFKGRILQTPPAYSAIKINGVRAYKLARDNKAVVIEPRYVMIEQINLQSYNYPSLSFSALVSSGTYIRSLVEDIGEDLGLGAYTTELRRTSIGQCLLDQAISPSSLNEQNISSAIKTELIV